MKNTEKKNRKPWLRGLIAACLALALVGAGAAGGMWYQQNLAVASVVSLDVNPSIELKVNQNERVLSCTGINADAAEVLAEMGGGKDLEGSKLDVAVNAVVGALVRHGYLDSLSSAILISVEDKDADRGARLQRELAAAVDGALQSAASQAGVLSQNVTADAELDAQAQANGISTGKAVLVKQAAALNSQLKFEELALLSVEELRDLIEIGAPAMPIGKDAAAAAVGTYAGISRLDADYLSLLKVDPELDDPRPNYEVEAQYGGREYDYRVDAFTGEVYSGQKDIVSGSSAAQTPGTQSPAPQTSPAVTAPDAFGIALDRFRADFPELSGYDVTNIKTEYDRDDNDYEAEFRCGGYEFDYTIDAASGAVLKFDTDYARSLPPAASPAPSAAVSTPAPVTTPAPAATPQTTQTPSAETADIGADAAKAAALAHAGLTESQVTQLKVERDWEDDHHGGSHHGGSHHSGRLEYEVEFKCSGYEYEYTIDAATGAILDHECDWDD